jgi:hypothetical protein
MRQGASHVGAGARSKSADSTDDAADDGEPGKKVAMLLESIPVELLARAAFQCGAHARALLYFETHVRAKEKGALNPVALSSATYSDDDVSFFQVRQIKGLRPWRAEFGCYRVFLAIVKSG